MGIKLLESPTADDGVEMDAYMSMTQDSSSFSQRSHRSARSTAPSTVPTVPATLDLEKGGHRNGSIAPFLAEEHLEPNEMLDSHARFVAGETFFNYDACGSLRPDLPEIKLFSAEYVGLAIHVTLVGFAYDFISYGYGRFLAEYFKATNQKQFNAANYVLVWPQALAVFIGIFADAFPLFDYRRKSYMVLGWIVSLTMYVSIILMDLLGPHHDVAARPYAVAYLVVSLVAAFGIQIAWVSGIALSIEFAQREQIYYRGRLQGALVALYYVGKELSILLAALVITDDMTGNHLVSMAAIFLAGVSVFAIPFVIFRLDEEPLSKSRAAVLSVKDSLSYFWKFCRQNVVYRVLFFLCLHLFLLGVYNQNVRDSVQKWSQVTRKTTMWIEAVRMVAQIAGSLVWRSYLRNTNWRKVVFWGTTVFIAMQTVLSLCTALDVVRNQWFYAILVVIADVPRSWLVLFSVILATEIAESGHEGISFALGLSFQSLAALAGYTLAEIFPNLFGFKVTPAQVVEDASSTRSDVAKAFAIVLAFNLMSYVAIKLVPRQKLDAQQMRSFGGYNQYGSYALLLLFVVLLCFNFAVNLNAVL